MKGIIGVFAVVLWNIYETNKKIAYYNELQNKKQKEMFEKYRKKRKW